jgi:GDPmannose 4,6-dehydratase
MSNNIYGHTKLTSTIAGRIYRDKGLKVSNAILGNHESFLRDERFVTGKISKGVAEISLGIRKSISLGNINVEKNWSSAYDIIEGLKLLAQSDESEDFIFVADENISLKKLIEISFNSVGIKNWKKYVKMDNDLFREVESKRTFSNFKAKKELGWRPKISPEKWMSEMVEHHLKKLSSNPKN